MIIIERKGASIGVVVLVPITSGQQEPGVGRPVHPSRDVVIVVGAALAGEGRICQKVVVVLVAKPEIEGKVLEKLLASVDTCRRGEIILAGKSVGRDIMARSEK